MQFLRTLLLGSILVWLVASSVASAAPIDELVALRVGRAITVSGDDIENATILIEAGRIRAIGASVEIPREARVIDRPDGIAMPGIIDVHTSVGLREPNERLADVPYVTVVDGIDPSSPGLENVLRHGVTTVHCIASNATRFGGQGAVIRTHGREVGDLIVKAPASMKMSLLPASGDTRMGNMAALRRKFFDLWKRIDSLQHATAGTAAVLAAPEKLDALISPRPAWDRIDWSQVPDAKIGSRDRAMVDLVRGELPAFIYVPAASDVFKAFELIDTNGLRGTLVLGSDAWKLADVLAARDELGPVVLSSTFEMWDADPKTKKERRRVIPRMLFDAGVEFAVQVRRDSRSDRGPSFGRRGDYHHWYQAARLVRYGIPRDVALRTITLVPAKILGLEHRLGSLEVGKDANVTVFTGDPLDARSWVDLVLIEGRQAYSRAEDADLERLLRKPERKF